MFDLENLQAGEDLADVIREKFNKLISSVRELENITGDDYISVDHDDGSGFRIIFHPERLAMPAPSDAQPDPVPESAPAAPYSGMFAVAADGTVNAGAVTGPGWFVSTAQTSLNFSNEDGTAYVVLSVGTAGEGDPSATVELADSFTGLAFALPGTGGNVQKFLLATVVMSGAVRTITQQQHGPVYTQIFRLAPDDEEV